MKKFLIALNFALLSVISFQVAQAAEPLKKPEAAKPAKKAPKKHKKFEGTKVPEKAPKK